MHFQVGRKNSHQERIKFICGTIFSSQKLSDLTHISQKEDDVATIKKPNFSQTYVLEDALARANITQQSVAEFTVRGVKVSESQGGTVFFCFIQPTLIDVEVVTLGDGSEFTGFSATFVGKFDLPNESGQEVRLRMEPIGENVYQLSVVEETEAEEPELELVFA